MSSSPGTTCDSCHTLHKAAGATITSVAGNYNLCMSCHSSRGTTFNWPLEYQAQPGGQGRSHRWDADAVNAAYGAQAPTHPDMVGRLPGGKLQCSTCHDQHTGANAFKGTQRTSVAVGAAITRTAGTGTGTLALDQPAAGATAKGYRIAMVVAGSPPDATFRVSNDNGVSWWGWSGGAWTAGAAAGCPTGANVALNDGANVKVTFAGAFLADDVWNFYVSYPFLRIANDTGQLCENCHVPRVQSAAYVESGGDGTKVFSHPVGEALSKGYDRAAGALLDADGQLQSTGDGLKTNDLSLDTASKVRCTSCHNPHNTDSNSLTEDLR
ncbi:MAG: cytochrome c3 family protein [Myxococcaceae bacterium]